MRVYLRQVAVNSRVNEIANWKMRKTKDVLSGGERNKGK